jgi:2-C-methyl-D-erythritol 4-phosphate cytidylyltransferase
VAGGSSARFGRPKLLEPLGDRLVIDHSVAHAAAACPGRVVVVLPPSLFGEPLWRGRWPACRVACGGRDRAESVRNGLEAVAPDAAYILVHDGARPLAGRGLFDAVLSALAAGAPGVIPVVPVSDTLKRVSKGRVVGTVERDELVAAQTPQGFRADLFRLAQDTRAEVTDDAGLLERLEQTVQVVPGHPMNLKITRPEDLALASAILALESPTR